MLLSIGRITKADPKPTKMDSTHIQVQTTQTVDINQIQNQMNQIDKQIVQLVTRKAQLQAVLDQAKAVGVVPQAFPLVVPQPTPSPVK